MALTESSPGVLNSQPPDFTLKEVDGTTVSLNDVIGENGILIMFICNHCPYVIEKIEKIEKTVKELEKLGINSIAVMSNDTEQYPEDSFEKMKEFKTKHKLSCKYVIDDTQKVAKAYDAQCTPDFYLYIKSDGIAKLKYRGRLDSGGRHNNPDDIPELYNAAREALTAGNVSFKQYPSMGCSIKWKKG